MRLRPEGKARAEAHSAAGVVPPVAEAGLAAAAFLAADFLAGAAFLDVGFFTTTEAFFATGAAFLAKVLMAFFAGAAAVFTAFLAATETSAQCPH